MDYVPNSPVDLRMWVPEKLGYLGRRVVLHMPLGDAVVMCDGLLAIVPRRLLAP